MRLIVKEIIRLVNDWIFDSDLEYEWILEELNSISLPVWNEMTNEEKMATLAHIYENCEEEDFTHSGCCTAPEQAATAFCVEYFKNQDLEILFDDLDFMMVSKFRENPEIAKLFGVSSDF